MTAKLNRGNAMGPMALSANSIELIRMASRHSVGRRVAISTTIIVPPKEFQWPFFIDFKLERAKPAKIVGKWLKSMVKF